MAIMLQYTLKKSKSVLILFFVWFFSLLNYANTQPIPNEFFQFKIQKLFYDSGENWESLTVFGPFRFQQLNNTNEIDVDSLYIKTRAGLHFQNNDRALYGFGHFTYQKYFYGYLYPRIVNDPNNFQRFSGLSRDISRGGFNSGETDLSGIGFQNSWLTFQVGRGRESWGAGNDIQLALSERSPAYDYVMLGSDYGNLRVNYIHGFLEVTSEGLNRYLTARGFEWTNRKSLIIGLSETIIYSGLNRSLDIGYLNPISTHLEVEWNNRLNILGESNANAVWQISVDCMIKEKLRLSGNYLIDDFTLDVIEKEGGKQHGTAYSTRFAYTFFNSKNSILTGYSSFVYVGTPTFRHNVGTNNFVQRGRPLGWQNGSDGQELIMGLNYFNKTNLIVSFLAGILGTGEESITARVFDPYEDYLKGIFPSGNVTRHLFINGQLQWWWKPNISSVLGFEWTVMNSNENQKRINMGIDIYLPYRFTI